jgi:serine/threonine protein kinase
MLGRESDFEELSQIGKGGYSSVFKCRNKLDNRLYALKKISLEKPKNSKAFKAEYNKVLEEVRHLCMLEHPNIVRYYKL